jgi:hypothetical protein
LNDHGNKVEYHNEINRGLRILLKINDKNYGNDFLEQIKRKVKLSNEGPDSYSIEKEREITVIPKHLSCNYFCVLRFFKQESYTGD